MKNAKAEAKVQVRDYNGNTKSWEAWRDSVDFDPIDIPVEDRGEGGTPLTTDVFDSSVMALAGALLDGDDRVNRQYRLVWSDTLYPVKGTCPVCDDVFVVGEGAPGDELNEGYDAVWCGCDPADAE